MAETDSLMKVTLAVEEQETTFQSKIHVQEIEKMPLSDDMEHLFSVLPQNEDTILRIRNLRHKLRVATSTHDYKTVDLIVSNLMSAIKRKCDDRDMEEDEVKSKIQSVIDYITETLFDNMPNSHTMRKSFAKAAEDGLMNEWPLLIAAGCGYKKSFIKVWEVLKDKQKQLGTDLVGNNCLVRAIKRNQRGVVKVILKMEDTELIMDLMKVCLHLKRSIFGYTYDTPLRMLIKHMPDMAKLFLDLCAEMKVRTNFIDDDEWALEESNSQASGKDTIKKKHHASFAHPCQSACAKVNKWLQKNQKPSNHVLNCIDANRKLALLKHPFISDWINERWKAARIIYTVIFIQYSCFISFLTAYSLLTPNPILSSTCINTTLGFDKNMSSTSDKNSFDLNHPNSPVDINCSFRLCAAIIVIIFAVMQIAFEILQVSKIGANYFRSFENYVQIFVFIGSIVFASNFERQCNCTDESRWQLGAFVLFCAWLNFIVLLKDYPTFGAPIKLLFNICYKYIKLVYLPLLLMTSFALPFYMVFVINDNGMNSIIDFRTLSTSLLRTWIGQTGDTGFSDVFLGAPLPYVLTATILFVIFLIMVPVLFNNMLIGLAVGDVKAAYEEADLNTLASQVKFILFVKDAVPPSLMKMLIGVTHNRSCICMCHDVHNAFQDFFMHHDTEKEHDTVDKEDLLAIEDNFMDELDDMKEQLVTMKQTMEQLRAILEDIKQNIKRESTV